MHTYSVDTLRQLATGDHSYAVILSDFARYGALTVQQIATLSERSLQPVAPVQQSLPINPSISRLSAAIDHARAKGVPQPIIRVAGFCFMPADPARARPENHGAIFVTTAERNGSYLGKVIRSTFLAAPACRGTQVERDVVKAMEDPYGAAVQYGRLTGRCSICDRTLSNAKSIELGIGPVCKAKFGG
jgi:hypothetical protein